MKRTIHLAVLAALLGTGLSAAAAAASPSVATTATDSAQLEKALQGLTWPQFKSVLEAIPKLKADVDAYGPLGWQIVEANYKTYGWKKSIDKLDEDQKRQLASLIQSAKQAR